MKWGIHFDVARKEEKIAELEYKMGEPTFWDDAEQAQKINQELNVDETGVKARIDAFLKRQRLIMPEAMTFLATDESGNVIYGDPAQIRASVSDCKSRILSLPEGDSGCRIPGVRSSCCKDH